MRENVPGETDGRLGSKPPPRQAYIHGQRFDDGALAVVALDVVQRGMLVKSAALATRGVDALPHPLTTRGVRMVEQNRCVEASHAIGLE